MSADSSDLSRDHVEAMIEEGLLPAKKSSAAITPWPSAESTTTVRVSNPGGLRLTPWSTWEWRPW